MATIRYPGPGAPAPGATGWDAWADDYAALGARNPMYALGKELLHELVDEVVPPRAGWLLDFHCGAGDDLARFLARGWHAVGCDGSPGMLAAAATRCAGELAAGRLELRLGRAEELDAGAFDGRRFELIFSTTGGFAYVDDAELVRLHRLLAAMLAPGGKLIVAHLGPCCAAESLYHLARLRPRRAVERWRGRAAVKVRGQEMLMRLRSPRRLRRLLDGVVRIERLAPLLVVSPPFQSGFAPGPRTLAALRVVERRASRAGELVAALADQVVCVASSPNSVR